MELGLLPFDRPASPQIRMLSLQSEIIFPRQFAPSCRSLLRVPIDGLIQGSLPEQVPTKESDTPHPRSVPTRASSGSRLSLLCF